MPRADMRPTVVLGLPRASPSPGERSRRTGRGVLGLDGLGRTSSLQLTASCGRKAARTGGNATRSKEPSFPDEGTNPPNKETNRGWQVWDLRTKERGLRTKERTLRTKERGLRTRKPTVAGRFETSGQGNGAFQTEWAAEGGRPGSAGETGRHVGGIAAGWGRWVDAAFFVPTPAQPR